MQDCVMINIIDVDAIEHLRILSCKCKSDRNTNFEVAGEKVVLKCEFLFFGLGTLP